jgi:hypothetical protein
VLKLALCKHWSPLKGKLARDLGPAAPVEVLVANADRHRTRDAMGAKQHKLKRVAPAPTEAALCVVVIPNMERGELIEDTTVVDCPRLNALSPGTNANSVWLREMSLRGDFNRGRLAVCPDTFFHCALKLGAMAFADEVGSVEVEGGVKEEAIVLKGLTLATAKG